MRPERVTTVMGVSGTAGTVDGATDTGVSDAGKIEDIKAGLTLSIDTRTSLLPFRLVNVLQSRCSTLNGPMYGGVSGRRTASTRRKIKGASAKAAGM